MAVAAAGAAAAAATEERWVEAATDSPTKHSVEKRHVYMRYIVNSSLISKDKSDQEEGAVSSNPPVHLCPVPPPPNPASAIQQD